MTTDAPLLPHQLKRIAARVLLGIGIVDENGSGDIFIAFSTATPTAFHLNYLVQKGEIPDNILVVTSSIF